MPYEYYVSTKKEKKKANTRFFATQTDSERKENVESSQKKRTSEVNSIRNSVSDNACKAIQASNDKRL